MKRIQFLILGAGPSGLALAHGLLQNGVPKSEILVLESQSEAGGLCRSKNVDGAPLDIGGGHFLDVRNKIATEFLFKFLPETEWNVFDRIAKIRLNGHEIDHPLESNLWQLPKSMQLDFLESIARAGCIHGDPMPSDFSSWIRWKLGDKIAEDYMLPYNEKIWSMELNRLGTYWLHKLPNASFRDTLQSCLEGKACGSLPAHGRFLYPKSYGYGEVWKRMGDALQECLQLNSPITKIDVSTRMVNDKWQADQIITTIPWAIWPSICKIPTDVSEKIGELRYSSIDIDYHPTTVNTTAHWVYEPHVDIAHHRILVRHNFCLESNGYWTETNSLRSSTDKSLVNRNEFAYPINTIKKNSIVTNILEWAKSHQIIGLGRWGTWEHLNSDIAVSNALDLSVVLSGENRGGK